MSSDGFVLLLIACIAAAVIFVASITRPAPTYTTTVQNETRVCISLVGCNGKGGGE